MISPTLLFPIIGGILLIFGGILLIFGIIIIRRSNKKIWKIVIGSLLILISIPLILKGIALLFVTQTFMEVGKNLTGAPVQGTFK